MTDKIPDDIDRTATDIVREPRHADHDPEWALYYSIAQALAAERERCAKIAEKERAYYEGINDGEWGDGAVVVSEKIRDAIRSPS